jgi:uncharacterized repeat protein (TIGR03803 family)
VACALPAQTLTTLYSFCSQSGCADGSSPVAGLLRDSAGNLYGTTQHGGPYNVGVVFKLDPSGNATVLHSFTGADGSFPDAGLIMDLAGNIYGTSSAGGASGGGTVFKLDPSGNETVLRSFSIPPCSGGPCLEDGGSPLGGLVIDPSGNLYGTTFGGGSILDGGIIFRVDLAGNETVLHRFGFSDSGPFEIPDGMRPAAGMIMDKAGNLYGTTGLGGSADSGTVFKLDPSGNETILYNFTGGSDGVFPAGDLVADLAGNLYGTTEFGGSAGFGTVFKLDSSGNEILLHSFTGGDGLLPHGGLVRDLAGNLYGTTSDGGAFGRGGTVFKLDSSGNEAVLYTFTGGSDGGGPVGDLVADLAGNLYGTTFFGGAHNAGTVFKLTVLTPQQATQAAIASVSALFSQGVLNGGQNNSLIVKLQHAINMMNAGKNAGAIGILQSFITEVNDLVASGVLTPSQAAPLISAAQGVIARL